MPAGTSRTSFAPTPSKTVRRTSERYADADPEVRLITVEDADHVESWNNDPELYKAEVAEFLESMGSRQGRQPVGHSR